jgi:hypothetical protein
VGSTKTFQMTPGDFELLINLMGQKSLREIADSELLLQLLILIFIMRSSDSYKAKSPLNITHCQWIAYIKNT